MNGLLCLHERILPGVVAASVIYVEDVFFYLFYNKDIIEHLVTITIESKLHVNTCIVSKVIMASYLELSSTIQFYCLKTLFLPISHLQICFIDPNFFES